MSTKKQVVFEQADFDPLFNPLNLAPTTSTSSLVTPVSAKPSVVFHDDNDDDDPLFGRNEKAKTKVPTVHEQTPNQRQQQFIKDINPPQFHPQPEKQPEQSQPQQNFLQTTPLHEQKDEEIVAKISDFVEEKKTPIPTQENPQQRTEAEPEVEEDIFSAASEEKTTLVDLSSVTVKGKKPKLFGFDDEEEDGNKQTKSVLNTIPSVLTEKDTAAGSKLDDDLFVVDDDKLEQLLQSVNSIEVSSDSNKPSTQSNQLFASSSSESTTTNISDDFDFSSYVKQQQSQQSASSFDFD